MYALLALIVLGGTLCGNLAAGVPGRGDVPVRENTWWSIELQSGTAVPEWDGQVVRMALEEDAYIDGDGRREWVLARQEKFHLVR